MATKLVFDSADNSEIVGTTAGAPRAVESVAPEDSPFEGTGLSHEPERRPYPGYARVGIFVGGAVACWAAIAGLISVL